MAKRKFGRGLAGNYSPKVQKTNGGRKISASVKKIVAYRKKTFAKLKKQYGGKIPAGLRF